jgi:hypothetical protein
LTAAQGPSPGGGPRRAFGIGAAIAVGVVVYHVVAGGGTEADYESAVARFGEDRIGRLVMATTPLAYAKHCHDSYGEDSELIDAVAAWVARTQPAAAALVAEIEATGTMTADEKLAIEQTVLARVDAAVDDQADCRAVIARIEAGEFDYAAPAEGQPPAQPEGN